MLAGPAEYMEVAIEDIGVAAPRCLNLRCVSLKISMTQETRWFTNADISNPIQKPKILAVNTIQKDKLGVDSQLKLAA
jgi:hypothetical protein